MFVEVLCTVQSLSKLGAHGNAAGRQQEAVGHQARADFIEDWHHAMVMTLLMALYGSLTSSAIKWY
jgi:hypothetical protein